MAQKDGESIDNLNYSWRQVSILHMCGMENNVLSVAILLSVNKKNAITHVRLMASVKKLPTLAPAMLHQKMQYLYQSILR